MALNPDWKEFVESLNSNEVEFLIVGAMALAFHGHPRLTGDIDFFVNNSPENAARVARAVQQFGFGSLGLGPTDFMASDRIVQLGFPPRRIDIITKLTGVSFEEAWGNRVPSLLDGLHVNYISLDDFIRNKQATGRAKDIADIEAVARDEEA